MKRKLVSLLLCLFLIGSGILSANAASPLVMDVANILSNTEIAALTEASESLQSSYGIDVVIVTMPSLMGKSPQSFADDFLDNNGYREDGILFLLDMGDRQWHVSTAGAAIDLISDRDLMEVEDQVVPYLSQGRYYDGFARFQNLLPRLLTNKDSGMGGGVNVLFSLIFGAVIALFAVIAMRSSMNTRKAAYSAADYQTRGSYKLTHQQDLFLYSNVSKIRRQQQSGGPGGPGGHGGGHSSVHRGSSGRSHGGRGGRF